LPFCHVTLSAKKPQSEPYPKAPITLGDHFRKRRLDLKLLQKDVGKLLGVDETTIWNWENNRSGPQLRLIPRIINFLGYDPLGPLPRSIGERLLKYRKRHGLSQKKLAKILAIDPATLSRLERGTAKTHKMTNLPSNDFVVFLSECATHRQ
jgi:transcriptional regulator with XRE-family HTH domain